MKQLKKTKTVFRGIKLIKYMVYVRQGTLNKLKIKQK